MCVLSTLHANEMASSKQEQPDLNDDAIYNPVDVQPLLPRTTQVAAALHLECLMSLNAFFHTFNCTLLFQHYDEKVWPMPDDLTPELVYGNARYDVKLGVGKFNRNGN